MACCPRLMTSSWRPPARASTTPTRTRRTTNAGGVRTAETIPVDDRGHRRHWVHPAELLPDKALLPVGDRLAGLHDRKCDEHRLHRRRHRQPDRYQSPDDLSADRRAGLVI